MPFLNDNNPNHTACDMKRLLAAMAVACLCIGHVYAQRNIVNSLRETKAGEGQVHINQDADITAMVMGEPVAHNADGTEAKKELKKQGYRVQVYAGNNTRQARTEANEVAEKVRKAFPEYDVYAMFSPPRWLCRVGNFSSIEEADAAMRSLRGTGEFKEVSIVKDQIVLAY